MLDTFAKRLKDVLHTLRNEHVLKTCPYLGDGDVLLSDTFTERLIDVLHTLKNDRVLKTCTRRLQYLHYAMLEKRFTC